MRHPSQFQFHLNYTIDKVSLSSNFSMVKCFIMSSLVILLAADARQQFVTTHFHEMYFRAVIPSCRFCVSQFVVAVEH